ncbi:hypothetical protein PT974_07135 [Cladobotryum mycophilum]|uniref:Mid2 domain-containing protein n=1 Tax=Cladobotryum mycophilum TaxID=491253 RepID=A0ABR0SNG0_9HYPO
MLAFYLTRCLAFVRLATATDKVQASFTFPVQKGLLFYEQDTVNVSYTSNISNASLWTFCWEGNNHNTLATLKMIQKAQPFNGSELIQVNFNINSDECWFNLRDNNTQGSEGVNNVPFSLTSNQRSQTTIRLTGPATTSAASTLGHSPTASATTTTGKNSLKTSHSGDGDGAGAGGLSAGAKAGIGVGVSLGAIGAAAALAGAVLLARRRWRGKQDDAVASHDEKGHEAYDNGVSKHGGLQLPVEAGAVPPPPPPQELAAQEAPQELPGWSPQR